MSDNDTDKLHRLVREAAETLQPEYNPAHWERMKGKLAPVDTSLKSGGNRYGLFKWTILFLAGSALLWFTIQRFAKSSPESASESMCLPYLAPLPKPPKRPPVPVCPQLPPIRPSVPSLPDRSKISRQSAGHERFLPPLSPLFPDQRFRHYPYRMPHPYKFRYPMLPRRILSPAKSAVSW
jgi:hypothetical protein